jgi:hypothetical protein
MFDILYIGWSLSKSVEQLQVWLKSEKQALSMMIKDIYNNTPLNSKWVVKFQTKAAYRNRTHFTSNTVFALSMPSVRELHETCQS